MHPLRPGVSAGELKKCYPEARGRPEDLRLTMDEIGSESNGCITAFAGADPDDLLQ
jgi:hypothetical protein